LRPKKIALVDRDGTINVKNAKGKYVKNWSEFSFLPGATEALAALTKKGYEIYVITNQPGIGRGMVMRKDVDEIHANMLSELDKHGAKINGVYYCPHHWDAGCECLKPKPGMLFQAAREHYFDLTKAVFIGDDERDGLAAEAAECSFIFVPTEKGIAAAIDKLPKQVVS
jgi:histidinol-phosphate phosphatase family protein